MQDCELDKVARTVDWRRRMGQADQPGGRPTHEPHAPARPEAGEWAGLPPELVAQVYAQLSLRDRKLGEPGPAVPSIGRLVTKALPRSLHGPLR